MSKIEVRQLTLAYETQKTKLVALEGVSFRVENGEFLSIIGPSGCGKSTLLSVLMGLLEATGGQVLINGAPITGPGTDRGVVFQQKSLFPWLTARKNVAFGIEQAKPKLSRKERLQITDEYLGRVGLSGYEDFYPYQLSGGMRQRAAIARAFAMDTDILLMDEPFSALDPGNRLMLQETLLDLWEKGEGEKKTVVFVTHDVDEAMLLSDRILVMNTRPGTIGEEFRVPFPRPRIYEELAQREEYSHLRGRIISLFHGDRKKGAEG